MDPSRLWRGEYVLVFPKKHTCECFNLVEHSKFCLGRELNWSGEHGDLTLSTVTQHVNQFWMSLVFNACVNIGKITESWSLSQYQHVTSMIESPRASGSVRIQMLHISCILTSSPNSAKRNLRLFNLNKLTAQQKMGKVELCCCPTLADKELKLYYRRHTCVAVIRRFWMD